MFLTLEIRDMHRNRLPKTKVTVNTAHIVRIDDEPTGPVVHMTSGESLRLVESYAALMSVLKANYLVAFKGVD